LPRPGTRAIARAVPARKSLSSITTPCNKAAMTIPKPRGPYSPFVRAGDLIFVSGQGPVDPATDEYSLGDIRHEVRVTLENIRRILEQAGATPADVVKCSVFLKNAQDFPAMNEVYAQFFGETRPARTTVEAQFYKTEMKVEIDCVAYKPRATK
jgi:2-iminobutanoate/2-iminopropanoate deaminase